jgi:hypothetical protein
MNPKPIQENPPQNAVEGKAQLQKKFETQELTPEQIKEIEVQEITDAEKAQKLSQTIAQQALETPKVIPQQETGTTFSVPPQGHVPPQGQKKNWFQKTLLGLGFLAAGTAGAQTADSSKVGNEKTPQAKEIKVSGSERVTPGKSASYKMGLSLYKGGKTREGSITPTGKLNAFENGKYSEEEVYDFAIKYGLRTTSNKDFQEDLFTIPGVKEKVLKKFGQTAAGTLTDGILGARTEFAMEEVEKGGSYGGGLYIEPTPEPNPEIPPVLEKAPPTLETADNIKIFFDLSSSMANDKVVMAEELENLKNNKPFEIIGFTSKAESSLTANSPQEAAQKILSLKESMDGNERAVKVTIQKLQEVNEHSFNPNEKNLVVWNTDEALQQINNDNLSELESLAKQQNITFDIRIKTEAGVKNLNLKDIRTIFDTHYKQKIETSMASISKKIESLEKELEQETSKSEKERIRGITENYKRNLEKSSTVNITGLEKI